MPRAGRRGSGHRYGSAATNATAPMREPAGDRARASGRRHADVRRRPSGRARSRVRHSQSTTIASPATPYRYLLAQAIPNATAAATSHARFRRLAGSVRQPRDAQTTDEQREERRDRLEHHLARVLDGPGVDREAQPAERATRPRAARPTRRRTRRWRAARRSSCGSGRSFAGGAVVGRSGISGAGGSGAIARPVTIFASDGCSVPVVVAQDDARVAGLEAGRDLLAGPQVVVLVEVDRQALDGDQAGGQGDQRDEDDRRPGHESAGDGQPVHPPESSPRRPAPRRA